MLAVQPVSDQFLQAAPAEGWRVWRAELHDTQSKKIGSISRQQNVWQWVLPREHEHRIYAFCL